MGQSKSAPGSKPHQRRNPPQSEECFMLKQLASADGDCGDDACFRGIHRQVATGVGAPSLVTNFIVYSGPSFLKIQSSVTILIFNASAL